MTWTAGSRKQDLEKLYRESLFQRGAGPKAEGRFMKTYVEGN